MPIRATFPFGISTCTSRSTRPKGRPNNPSSGQQYNRDGDTKGQLNDANRRDYARQNRQNEEIIRNGVIAKEKTFFFPNQELRQVPRQTRYVKSLPNSTKSFPGNLWIDLATFHGNRQAIIAEIFNRASNRYLNVLTFLV